MSADNVILDLEKVIKDGAKSLRSALEVDWPNFSDKNEIAEANLTVHIASALIKNKYVVFAETPVSESSAKSGRNDLIATRSSSPIEYIAFEFKRFLKTDDSGPLKDLRRFEGFKAINASGEGSYAPSYGVLVLMTYKQNVCDWWLDTISPVDGLPKGMRSKTYVEISKLLNDLSTKKGSFDISQKNGCYHRILYAICDLRA